MPSDRTDVSAIERAKTDDALARRAADGANFREHNRPFDFTGTAVRYGLMGGVVLGVIQLLVIVMTGRIDIGKGLFGMFVIAPFVYLGLRAYRMRLAGGEVAKNGLLFSVYLSVVAAGVMAAITLIGSLIGVGGDDVEATFGMVAVYSFFQFVIGAVFGTIIGFTFIQGMKSDVPADQNIEKVEGHA